jgi:hypothetical protein
VLYVALAIAVEIAIFQPRAAPFAEAVMLVVCALSPALLALALFGTFEHPPKSWIATVLLAFALLAGLGAALSGAAVLSLAALCVSIFAMLALSARRWRLNRRGPVYAIIAALCLLCGAAVADGGGGRAALALFSAVGLLGISLALARRLDPPVAEQGGRDLRLAAIGGQR